MISLKEPQQLEIDSSGTRSSAPRLSHLQVSTTPLKKREIAYENYKTTPSPWTPSSKTRTGASS